MQELITKLNDQQELNAQDIHKAVADLLNPEISDNAKAQFLRILHTRGETAQEIAGFVQELLAHAVDPLLRQEDVSGPLLDVCGTGGDKLHLFNISTTSMFILSAGGAVVVKHGNRGITSKCGGADVLEALGIVIDLPPAAFRDCVRQAGIGFLFAPLYHPAFKAIAPVRKQLAQEGQPTIFNLLGPLLNPVQPEYQLVGVFNPTSLPKFPEIFQLLGRRHAWAVHGTTPEGFGMDEISTLHHTSLAILRDGKISHSSIIPSQFGFPQPSLTELQGNTAETNADILVSILDGSLQGPKRDITLLNAAAGFVITEIAPTIEDGLALAQSLITSGKAIEKLHQFQKVSQALRVPVN